MGHIDRIFRLQPYAGNRGIVFNYVVMTPEPVDSDIVTAAWAYAVRYTAKGLDLPDHDAAIQMMLDRHPSWQVMQAAIPAIPVTLAAADNDIPEG